MNDPITPHFRNAPASTSRFIQTVTTVAALVVCIVALAGHLIANSGAR